MPEVDVVDGMNFGSGVNSLDRFLATAFFEHNRK